MILPITSSKGHKIHDHNQSSDTKTFEKTCTNTYNLNQNYNAVPAYRESHLLKNCGENTQRDIYWPHNRE